MNWDLFIIWMSNLNVFIRMQSNGIYLMIIFWALRQRSHH